MPQFRLFVCCFWFRQCFYSSLFQRKTGKYLQVVYCYVINANKHKWSQGSKSFLVWCECSVRLGIYMGTILFETFIWIMVLYTWHLLHFCPSWERDPSHVALSEVSTFFLPVKRVFSSFSLLLLRVKGRGCHTLLKPYETNCGLWIWAIQIKFDWLIDWYQIYFSEIFQGISTLLKATGLDDPTASFLKDTARMITLYILWHNYLFYISRTFLKFLKQFLSHS